MDSFLSPGVALTPLEGGWSGETFVAEAGGERTVVRIYADPRHSEHAAEITASLLGLVRGLLPVPQVLEVRRRAPDGEMPALLVTDLLPGVRGDLVLPTLDDDGLRRAGEAIGEVAAVLAGMPMRRAGLFVDGDLNDRAVRRWRPSRLGRAAPDRPGAPGLVRRSGVPARRTLPSGRRGCSTPSGGSAWCTPTSTRRTCSSIPTPWP